MKNPESPLVCTIGHSNRDLDTFLDLLRRNEIERVLDVRTVPRSRHNPQFGQDALPESLKAAGIAYTALPGLGGLRHACADSPNTGWRNASFRGYADYMQTPEFAKNVEKVAKMARSERCVLMCAEAVPWRCHRSMIGDALLVRGVQVEDIIGPGARKPHRLTPFAVVDGTRITYPGSGPAELTPVWIRRALELRRCGAAALHPPSIVPNVNTLPGVMNSGRELDLMRVLAGE